MSDVAMWIIGNGVLGFTVYLLWIVLSLSLMLMFGYWLTSTIESSILKIQPSASDVVKSRGFIAGILLCCLTYSFAIDNAYVSGSATIAGDISVQIKRDNQYQISYFTKEYTIKGYDLAGLPIKEEQRVLKSRRIFCQFAGKTIGYRECWNSFKDKTKNELITMSVESKKHYSYSN